MEVTAELPPAEEDVMKIDCGACILRGDGCSDCLVTHVLGAPDVIELDAEYAQALQALAEGGLVPPLRLRLVTESDPFARWPADSADAGVYWPVATYHREHAEAG